MKPKHTLLSLVALAAIVLVACGGGYYVQVPPPPPRYGVMGYAPGPGFVWTEGFWDWRGGAWVWAPGAWRRAPYAGAAWVAPRWVPYGRRYRFVRGYWRR